MLLSLSFSLLYLATGENEEAEEIGRINLQCFLLSLKMSLVAPAGEMIAGS